jgi:hypothetical protein
VSLRDNESPDSPDPRHPVLKIVFWTLIVSLYLLGMFGLLLRTRFAGELDAAPVGVTSATTTVLAVTAPATTQVPPATFTPMPTLTPRSTLYPTLTPGP